VRAADTDPSSQSGTGVRSPDPARRAVTKRAAPRLPGPAPPTNVIGTWSSAGRASNPFSRQLSRTLPVQVRLAAPMTPAEGADAAGRPPSAPT
jgi:hypothetical protein